MGFICCDRFFWAIFIYPNIFLPEIFLPKSFLPNIFLTSHINGGFPPSFFFVFLKDRRESLLWMLGGEMI
jgi:hypothetical protein